MESMMTRLLADHKADGAQADTVNASEWRQHVAAATVFGAS